MTVRELLEVAEKHTYVDICDENDKYVSSGHAEDFLTSTAPIYDRKVDTFEVLMIRKCPVLVISLKAKEDG